MGQQVIDEKTVQVRQGGKVGRRWVGEALAVALILLGQVGVANAGSAEVRPTPQAAIIPDHAPVLRARGRFFVDPAGRVVILRGVNLAGNSKVPPFLPGVGPEDLDRIRRLGMNAIRLLFIWEAYEPSPGVYDEAYLQSIRAVAAAAGARGIHVILDFHQDGFSRHVSRGAGDGFPRWAVSGKVSVPDNGPGSKNWPLLMATDRSTYRSFRDFYSDRTGVRTRYLLMLDRVAAAFSATPGVVGYDPINEPWGHERRELAPLFDDAAMVIRSRHPSAILFIEGHITTNSGIQTRLPRPRFDNVAYAPHYYKPSTIAFERWDGSSRAIGNAFEKMEAKSREWDAPLILGEFGAGATIRNAGDYVATLFDHLDAGLSSGIQWNYTPGWNPIDKDGWNAEDFNILDPAGGPRPNFQARPYPRQTAGIPLRFSYREDGPTEGVHTLEFAWENHPERGVSEIYLPTRLFPPDAAIATDAPGVQVWRDLDGQRLICRSPIPGVASVRLTARTHWEMFVR